MQRFTKPKRKSYAGAKWGISAAVFFGIWAIVIPHPISLLLVIIAAGAGILALIEGKNGSGEWFEITETSITFGWGKMTKEEIRIDDIAVVIEEDLKDSICISFVGHSGVRIASYDTLRWFSTEEIMREFLRFLTDHDLQLEPLQGRSSRTYQLLSRSALQSR